MLCLMGILLLVPTASTALRCYHCGHPSRMITPDIWIHKTATCTKRRIMRCSPASVACVVVRVQHPRIGFSGSGCSEDSVVGCDIHDLPGANATVQRCQCVGDLCNTDLHLKPLGTYGNKANVPHYQLHLLDGVPTTTALAIFNTTRTKSKSHKHVHGQRLRYKDHHRHRTLPPILATMPTAAVSSGATKQLGISLLLGFLNRFCVLWYGRF